MFQKHFAMTRDPFGKSLAPDELFESASGKEMEARVRFLFDLRGVGLFTGEPGAGKTTIGRKVTDELHAGLYRVLYVPLSTGNVTDMYKTIAWELGLPTERSKAALYKCIRSEVTRLCVESKLRPILIIDEAHHLRSDVLEDLRLLTNYAMDSQNRLCLMLIGQVELRRRLRMAVHEALAQRIVVTHHLTGLERSELPAYVAHLLRLAGVESPLFADAALETVFQATNGMPRKVNLLARHAMTAAAITGAREVNEEHVRQATQELV